MDGHELHTGRARQPQRRRDLGAALLRARRPDQQPAHVGQSTPLRPRHVAQGGVHSDVAASRHPAGPGPQRAGHAPDRSRADEQGLGEALGGLAPRSRRPDPSFAAPARQSRRLHRLRLPEPAQLCAVQPRRCPRRAGAGGGSPLTASNACAIESRHGVRGAVRAVRAGRPSPAGRRRVDRRVLGLAG